MVHWYCDPDSELGSLVPMLHILAVAIRHQHHVRASTYLCVPIAHARHACSTYYSASLTLESVAADDDDEHRRQLAAVAVVPRRREAARVLLL